MVLPTERTFSTLVIEVVDTNIAERPRYEGISGVGFAEVRIPGVGIEEVVRPPTALLDRAGPSSIEHRLVWVLTRLRSNPAEPVRGDEEQSLRRALQLPTDRDVSLEGQARLSAELDDAAVCIVIARNNLLAKLTLKIKTEDSFVIVVPNSVDYNLVFALEFAFEQFL